MAKWVVFLLITLSLINITMAMDLQSQSDSGYVAKTDISITRDGADNVSPTELYFIDSKEDPGSIRSVNLISGTVNKVFSRDASRIYSFAMSGLEDIYFVDDRKYSIFETNISSANTSIIFTHKDYIKDLELRNIGDSSQPRLYFSDATGAGGDGIIYYLNSTGQAVPYYNVGYTMGLTDVGGYWNGNFAFDDQDNLYLSSGNHRPASIYRISKAMADNVSGNDSRIYTDPEGLITGMVYAKPNYLYFADHGSRVYKLDLNTLKKEVVYVGNTSCLNDISFTQNHVKHRNTTEIHNGSTLITGAINGSTVPNNPPIINDLMSAQDGTTAITWTASAEDPDNDQILYRFLLNGNPMTNWITDNKWILDINDVIEDKNRIEVLIKDGKHANSNDYDDAKSVEFTLSSMKLGTQKWQITPGSPGDMFYSVRQVSDGGYIIAGTTGTYHGAGGGDAWLVKVNPSGNIEWDRTFGGSNRDVAYSVGQTSDGGYIIAGSTTSYGPSTENALIIKTDSLGNKEWEKTFAYGGDNNNQAKSVQQTSDGGYIFGGLTVRLGGPEDAWLVKTDSFGNKEWENTFGGRLSEEASFIQQTSDGGYIIAGRRQLEWGGYSNYGAWIIKTDSLGNKEWESTFDNGNMAYSVQQTKDGGYIVDVNNDGALLIKTDSLGNKEWEKIFKQIFKYSWGTAGSRIQLTSDGGYILIYDSLIKTDSQGNEEWRKAFGKLNGSQGYSIQQTRDGGYIVAGETLENGWLTAWLMKTDDMGDV